MIDKSTTPTLWRGFAGRGTASRPPFAGRHRARCRGLRAAALTLLALLATSGARAASAQEEGWVVERFAAVIDVGADATLRVSEAIDVDFQDLERHGIYREIPVAYEYDETRQRNLEIDEVAVVDGAGDEVEVDISREGGNLRLRIGDPNRTVTGRQSYRIDYVVRGALNSFDDHEELYWNVTGNEWQVPVLQASAQVGVPGDALMRIACYEGPRGSNEPCRMVQTSASAASFASTGALSTGSGLTVVVGMTKGSVQVPPPLLARKPRTPDQFFETSPAAWLGSLATLVIGAAAVARAWWRHGRDRRFTSLYYLTERDEQETRPIGSRDQIVIEYQPPEGLRPAEIGLLLDERADTKDVAATIIDLAVRGYLTITELPEPSGLGRLLSDKDWLLTRKREDTAELSEYERMAFQGLWGEGSEVRLSDLKEEYYVTLSQVADELYDSATERGWFQGNPRTARNVWLGVGLALAVGGVLLTGFLGYAAGLGLLALPLVPLGAVIAWLSRSMASRTARGSELLRRALGFREYMVTAEKDRQRFFEQAHIFSEYLPYAIVFGCVERWARAFAGIEAATATAAGWYVGGHYANPLAFSSAVQGLDNQVSRAIASTPAASGSSGFGGGFSGGGVGGGGGGSW